MTGRVTRAVIEKTTGDSKLDEAVRATLTNLQLQEPPPAGMPMPIVLHLKAIRP